MVIEDYAEELAKDISGDEFEFDPLLVLAIIQALAAIVSLWKNCQPTEMSPGEVREFVAKGGPARRRMRCRLITRAIRQDLTEEELAILGDPWDFAHYFVTKGVSKESFDAAYWEECKA